MRLESQTPQEKTRHTIRRLEAFSDIVIGFCLAQVGLGLVLPRGANDILSVWESTTFFISAFIFVALLWWFHHRTFTDYFVLNPAMVVTNFAVLCTLILTLYFFEGALRVWALGQNPTRLFALFVFCFALVYTLVGAMLAGGLAARRGELTATEIRWALDQLANIAFAIFFGLGVGAYAVLNGWGTLVAIVMLAAMIAVVIAKRLLGPRLLEHAAPEQHSQYELIRK